VGYALIAVVNVKTNTNARKMMSEPQYLEGDDFALKDECDECGNFIHTCECNEPDPDRMHDEMHED